jgi:hypothetical protein
VGTNSYFFTVYGYFNICVMQVIGTKQAFEAMISQRGIYKTLGVSVPTVSNWKRYIASGRAISLDKMEEMLQKFGAKVVKDKIWEV